MNLYIFYRSDFYHTLCNLDLIKTDSILCDFLFYWKSGYLFFFFSVAEGFYKFKFTKSMLKSIKIKTLVLWGDADQVSLLVTLFLR